MPIVPFTLLPLNQPALSSQPNALFNAAYNLLGFTGSPGTLDFANFGSVGVKLSQINSGTFSGLSTDIAQISGGLNVNGSLALNGTIPVPGVLSFGSGIATGGMHFVGFNSSVFSSIWTDSRDLPQTINFYNVNGSSEPGNGPTYALITANGGATGFGALPVALDGYYYYSPPTTHMVIGSTVTANNGIANITLSGPAAFSSATSYVVIATIISSSISNSNNPIYIYYSGASTFTINAGNTGVAQNVDWFAIGY